LWKIAKSWIEKKVLKKMLLHL